MGAMRRPFAGQAARPRARSRSGGEERMRPLAHIVTIVISMAAALVVTASAAETIRKVGVLAHRGDQAARTRWQPTFDAIGFVTPNVRFEVLPLSLDGVKAALARNEIDYLFTNPGHFHRLSEYNRLFPMVALRSDSKEGSQTGNRFGAVIFVRSDNREIETLADLKGKRLAAVAPDAFGGFEIAAATLIRNGVNPWNDLDPIAFLGFPQRAVIDAVTEGAVDAGTVRTGILEAAIITGKVDAEKLRIINPLRVPGFQLALSTELVTEWIFSSTVIVPEPERRSVAITMLGLESGHPAVAAGQYGGWTTVPSDTAVRNLLQTVDAARPETDPPSIALTEMVAVTAGSVPFAIAILIYWRSRRAAFPPNAKREAAEREESADVHLTPRERQILVLVGGGKTTKEIARDLGISPKTVEFHRSSLMRKYDAHNMAELVLKAGDALAA